MEGLNINNNIDNVNEDIKKLWKLLNIWFIGNTQ